MATNTMQRGTTVHISQQNVRHAAWRLLIVAVTAVLLVAFTFVFFWMILTSLKHPRDVAAYPPVWIFTPTLDNYLAVLEKTPFLQQLRNSVIVAVGVVILSFLFGMPAAYSIARFRQRRLALLVLVTRMIPGMSFLLPLFIVYKNLDLIDTHLGLMISHLILVLPLTVWIMMAFFEDIPIDLEDQARVDGASLWGAFRHIALPLALPGAVVTAILGFILSWNDLVFVLILAGGKTATLPMSVFIFMGTEELNFGGVAAAAALLSLPVILLSLIAQRWLVEGLTLGAVK